LPRFIFVLEAQETTTIKKIADSTSTEAILPDNALDNKMHLMKQNTIVPVKQIATDCA
jgi:hypothetical protein